MFDGKFLNLSDYGAVKVIDEVKYWSDIALQSYDEHAWHLFVEFKKK